MTPYHILDDVLPDPDGYRAAILGLGGFHSITIGPGSTFHGIAFLQDHSLPHWIAARYPALTPELTILRQSPAGQQEPHYIHTDTDMGAWTGILYLTPHPPAEDGTAFWRHRATGAIASPATTDDERTAEALQWRDDSQWERWAQVPAKFNRLLLFPAALFHSRALVGNYGEGEAARLIQIVFGTGELMPAAEEQPCP